MSRSPRGNRRSGGRHGPSHHRAGTRKRYRPGRAGCGRRSDRSRPFSPCCLRRGRLTAESLDAAFERGCGRRREAIPEACSATCSRFGSGLRQRRGHAPGQASDYAGPTGRGSQRSSAPTKDSRISAGALDEVKQAAQQHPHHPRLRDHSSSVHPHPLRLCRRGARGPIRPTRQSAACSTS